MVNKYPHFNLHAALLTILSFWVHQYFWAARSTDPARRQSDVWKYIDPKYHHGHRIWYDLIVATRAITDQFSGGFGGGNTANATSAFGAKPATGFGAFGGGTGAFGGGATTAFGQPAAAPATSAFGQPAAATSAFGSTSAFGAKPFGATGKCLNLLQLPVMLTIYLASTTAGTSHPVVTSGTSSPPFATTAEKDVNLTLQFQSISCMPAYVGYSHEVCLWLSCWSQ